MTPWHWRTPAMIVMVSWFVVLCVFSDTAVSMVTVWYHSNTFAHGFLILPISLYLIWWRRHSVAAIKPIPNFVGFLLLGGLGCLWFLGNLMNVSVVQQLAVVAMLPALVWTVLGDGAMRAFLFPLAFLLFMVPIGEEMVPPLQDFTALFTVTALQLSGIPVLWEGRFLTIPTGTWHIAEACAGVRYVIPSVTLGFLFAGINYRSWVRRILFMLAAFLVPIVANGFRAYGSVLLAHLTNNTFGKGVEHFISGWLGFGVVMLIVFLLGLYWRESADSASAEFNPELRSVTKNAAFELKTGHSSYHSTAALALTAAGGLALLTLAPLSAQALSNHPLAPVNLQPTAPSVTRPWTSLPHYAGNWKPQFAGTDAEVFQSYTQGDRNLHLYLNYYAQPRQGAEVVSRMNSLVDGDHWAIVTEGSREVIIDGNLFTIEENVIQSSHGTRLVWSWYWVAGDFTSNPYRAKLYQLRARLSGEPPGEAVIALSTDYVGDKTEALTALQDFLRHTSVHSTIQSFSAPKYGRTKIRT